jgi:hypothetical protein
MRKLVALIALIIAVAAFLLLTELGMRILRIFGARTPECTKAVILDALGFRVPLCTCCSPLPPKPRP